MINIRDEISPLKTVIVGIAIDRGKQNHVHNATNFYYQQLGQSPQDEQLIAQLEQFSDLLKQRGVKVIHPVNLPQIGQIFVRDLGFVVGDTFVWSNPKKPQRVKEKQGLQPIIASLGIKTWELPPQVTIEGGDVVIWQNSLLVGIGDKEDRRRSDPEAIDILAERFSDWQVIPIHTKASDNPEDDPKSRILHLDCGFTPLGQNYALFYPGGFSQPPEFILDQIKPENLITVSGEEMFHLTANLVSLDPTTVISDLRFSRVNQILRNFGFEVIETPYGEVAKLGGLFRCSTLPLKRQ